MSLSSLLYGGLLLLQIITMNLLFTDYCNDYYNKFEEKRLQIAVNYAVDAATKEMINNSANLGQDYETLAKLNVDPVVAMDTYSTIICKNYNVPVNSINQQSIMLDYTPVFMVATYDGYYLANRVTINSSNIENMVFTPKLPYSQVIEEKDGSKTRYSYNMSLKTAIKVDGKGNVTKVTSPPISEKEQSDLINTKISDVLNEALVKYATTDPRGEIYIPSEATTVGSTNPIRYTTVFAYIDNFDLAAFGMDLQSFGIGGSEIKQKKVVVGFTIKINGKDEKYYAYSDKVPQGANPVESFDSQEDAAEAGYYHYVY